MEDAPEGDCAEQNGAQEEADEAGALEEPLSCPQASEEPRRDGRRGTVRLTLSVPRQLHTRLKLAAVRQERSIVSLVSGWIEERTVEV